MPKLVKRGKNYAVEFFDPEKGFTTRASLGTDDPGVARRKYGEWCLKNVTPDKAETKDVYVEGLMAQFYVQQAKDFPSKYAYKSALAYCSEHLAGVTLEAFGLRRQEQFVNTLRSEGLSDGTIGRIMGAISRSVTRAYQYGEITAKPYILAVQSHNPRQRIFSDDEAKELLESATSLREKHFLSLAFLTAARPQAIIDMEKSQFDFSSKLVDLNPVGRKQNPKKHRPVIPMCHSLEELASGFKEGAIFVVGSDHKMKSSRPIVEGIGWPKGSTAYTIRHTVATKLRAAGVPEFEVSAYLGHKPPGVNRQTLDYAKWRPDFMRKAAEAVDDYWKKINEKPADDCGTAGTNGLPTAGGSL
jgi:integrase